MEKLLRQTLSDGRFEGVTARRSQAMRAVRGKDNRTTERKLRFALVRARMRGWTLNARAIDGCPDFYFPTRRVAIFVDGCFWHGCPKCGHIPKANSRFWAAKIRRNQTRDGSISERLRERGYRVLRLWEHELREDLAGCVRRIGRAITTRNNGNNGVGSR